MQLRRRVRLVFGLVWDHPSNEGRRIRALARAVRFQLRGRLLHRRTLVKLGDRSKVWAEVHFSGSTRAVYGNPPDWAEMHAWRRLLRPDDLFVDVGANVGIYSLVAAELGADVVAIEPHPEAITRLHENVTMNDANVEVIEAAATATGGHASITDDLDVRNRLVDEGGLDVPAVTLDHVIGDRRCRGVKVDVEGFEREVLLGATRALAEGRIDALQLEWNHWSRVYCGETREPLAELLQSYGYTLAEPDRDGRLHEVTDVGFRDDDLFAIAPGLDVLDRGT